MNKLLATIVDDDAGAVTRLLEADVTLATRLMQRAKLYDADIFHRIYVEQHPPTHLQRL